MFYTFIQFIEIFFQVIGLLVLLSGGVAAIVQFIALKPWTSSHSMMKEVEFVRLAFGQKIVFGLEFFVMADALATIANPSIEELLLLALIVAIRSVLSFFISRELYILQGKV